MIAPAPERDPARHASGDAGLGGAGWLVLAEDVTDVGRSVTRLDSLAAMAASLSG
jgi:hypothetical protein